MTTFAMVLGALPLALQAVQALKSSSVRMGHRRRNDNWNNFSLYSLFLHFTLIYPPKNRKGVINLDFLEATTQAVLSR